MVKNENKPDDNLTLQKNPVDIKRLRSDSNRSNNGSRSKIEDDLDSLYNDDDVDAEILEGPVK